MNWIFWALLAPFIYAVNVFLDKYLISAKIPDYRSLPIFGVFLAFSVVAILGMSDGFEFANARDALLIVLTGVLTIWAFSLYLEGLKKEETSVIIILIQLVPVLVFGLSHLILGETITFKQVLGFLFLFISSILVSLKKEKSSFRISKGLICIVLADIFWAIPYILIKLTSTTVNFRSLVLYESIGVILGGIFLLLFVSPIRNSFLRTLQKVKKPVLGLVFFNESLFLIAKIITYLALTVGPVTLVSILGSIQIFFGILLGISLTMLMPKVFREDLSKKGLIRRGMLGLLAFAGIILIS